MSGNEIAALTQSAFTEGFKEGELYILEKLKTEIMGIGNWREHYEMPIGYLSCLTIVEHYISELEGE